MLAYVATVLVAITLGWSSCLLWQSVTTAPHFVEINNEQLFNCLKEQQ